MGLFCIWQEVHRLLTLIPMSETEVQRCSDLEIRPVLLQLGVVHVNFEKLVLLVDLHLVPGLGVVFAIP